MKYFKRANVTKNSTGSLYWDHNIDKAYSYSWYVIYNGDVNGFKVINTYNYSSTTVKHISSMWDQVGYSSGVIPIEAPNGLQDLQGAIDLLESRNKELAHLMAKPRTHKAKNEERADNIRLNNLKIEFIKTSLMATNEVINSSTKGAERN